MQENLPFNKTLIIIPTYNEMENIEKMIQAIFNESLDFSLLIIDDGSPDKTAQKVKMLQKHFPNLYLLEREGKLGLGSAYVLGFKWAIKHHFDFVFEMDCDFSHDPRDLKQLLGHAQSCDLVIGSRYIDGIRIINWPFKRLLLSYCASVYTRTITRMPIFDTTGGFKCFSQKALKALNLDKIISNGYSFQVELNYKVWDLGLKIIEHPIIFTERRDGQSKMTGTIIIEAIFAVWKLRLYKFLGILHK